MLKQIHDSDTYLKKIHNLNQKHQQNGILATLSAMQTAILEKGDQAVLDYSQQFDGITPASFSFFVTEKELREAYDKTDANFIKAIQKSIENIRAFHEKQRPKDWTESRHKGSQYGMQYTPLDSAGLYVPGGRAPYFSTVMMNAIPATIAGVRTLTIATPPQQDGSIEPQILVAADCCGIKNILKVGGAQAIFALAYSTPSIPKVDKIVGPGNIYVDTAKQMVFGQVAIDKPAGPSDVLIYIDDAHYSTFAAAECLAQLEHDPNAIACVLATNETIVQKTQAAFLAQLTTLSRKKIIKESAKNSGIILSKNEESSLTLINKIAAEHVVLLSQSAETLRKKIHHAGAIFCGPYTPVTLGDYYAGPNHVLPTSGAARFSSPLSVMDFMKFSSHLTMSKDELKKALPTLKILTEKENFDAHYNAAAIRFKNKD